MNKPLVALMWGVRLFVEKHTQWYLHAGMIYRGFFESMSYFLAHPYLA
jgi:hypothetical protein